MKTQPRRFGAATREETECRTSGGMAPRRRVDESVAQAARRGSFYGRMFPDLPAFRPESASLRELADRMKKVSARRRAEATTRTYRPATPTSGSFVDHDLTLDTASTLDRFHDPERLRNFRTPRFDLDSLYGRGPRRSPALYDPDAYNVKPLVGRNRGTRASSAMTCRATRRGSR